MSVAIDAGYPDLIYIHNKRPIKMILKLADHMAANESLFSEDPTDRGYFILLRKKAYEIRNPTPAWNYETERPFPA